MCGSQWLPTYAKLVLLLAYIAATNRGLPDRVRELVGREEYLSLALFAAIWATALVCLIVASFLPRLGLRALWAVPIALSVFVGEAFTAIAQSRLTLDDVLTLWLERSHWRDITTAYGSWLVRPALEAGLGLLIMCSPTRLSARGSKVLTRGWWMPPVPFGLVLAVLLLRGGWGTGGLPSQFLGTTLFGTAVAIDAVSDPGESRARVSLVAPQPRAPGDVVLVVEESLRADYFDSRELFGRWATSVADFSPAVSAGNCSNSSNAIIRLGGTRADLAGSIHRSPYLWDYAREAGYQTVYLDGQRSRGGLQNWMTAREVSRIDVFEQFGAHDRLVRDREIARRLRELVLDGDRQFVLVNKSGAHFPYEEGYPSSEAVYTPRMGADESIGQSRERLVNSYRNVIHWNVRGFFDELLSPSVLSGSVLLYTSDHGQNLMESGRVLHCNTGNPSPYEAWVPLVVVTSAPELREQLRDAARRNRGRVTHFEIYPTLLRLFGYEPSVVARRYGPDLLADLPLGGRRFTVGPVILYFGRQPRWSLVPVGFPNEYETPGS